MSTLVTTLVLSCAGLAFSLAPEETKGTITESARSIMDEMVASVQQFIPDKNTNPANPTHYDQSNLLGGIPSGQVTAAPDSARSAPVVTTAAPDTSTAVTGTDPDPITVVTPPANTAGQTAAGQASQSNASTPDPKPTPKPAQVAKVGWLRISAEPMGEIYVDGRYRTDTPPEARIELTRGPHTVEVRNPQYKTYHEALHITAGELSRRRVTLTKLSGSVQLTTIAGAEVYVDGRFLGLTPIVDPIQLDTGPHQITVKRVGYNTWSNEITLEEDQVLPLRITLSPIY